MSDTPTKTRTLCPFTLQPDGWTEEQREDGSWIGTSTIDGSRMCSESLEGIERSYETVKAISVRCRDLKEKHGTWEAALAAYQQDLGDPPYHRVVRLREPFLERMLTQLSALVRKERGY